MEMKKEASKKTQRKRRKMLKEQNKNIKVNIYNGKSKESFKRLWKETEFDNIKKFKDSYDFEHRKEESDRIRAKYQKELSNSRTIRS